jgi:hypothetical protein
MTTKTELLDKLASQWGTTVEDMIEQSIFDSCAPGICTQCQDYSTEVEPDCRHGHCEICGTQTVKSALVLAGLI